MADKHERGRKIGSMHRQDHADHAPVQEAGEHNRPVLADGKGLNAFGLGDGNHYTDIMKPHAPAADGSTEATSESLHLGESHAVDNTMGIHKSGAPGRKRS